MFCTPRMSCLSPRHSMLDFKESTLGAIVVNSLLGRQSSRRQGINPWRHSGKFPVGKAKLKTVSNIRVQNMSHLDFFCQLYFMNYIKDVVIPETNKYLNSPMVLGEYFCMIGCCLIMACYVGHSARDLFLKDPITPPKGAPIGLNHIISGRRLEKITQATSYINFPILEYDEPFFHQRQMEEGWNRNMAEIFDPSWVSVLDESIQEWINCCTRPGCMFVPHNPHPFGNEHHTIACELSKVIYHVEIVEGKDLPRGMGRKEFDEKGATSGLMVRMTKPIWGMGKVVIMDSRLCILEGLILMVEKGFSF